MIFYRDIPAPLSDFLIALALIYANITDIISFGIYGNDTSTKVLSKLASMKKQATMIPRM